MSDVSQARAPAADAGEPVDDGLNDQERAEFAQMEKETSAPSDEAAAPADAPADGAAPPAAAEGDAAGPDDEDDEAEGASEPVLGADGKPAVDAQGKPVGRVKKRVSFKKYDTEKQRADAAEKKLSESALREARFDERMKIINEAIQPQQQPVKTAAEEDPEPDKEADLFAWLDWDKRDKARLRDEVTAIKSERQAEREERELSTTYEDDAAAFVQQEPTFGYAYNYLMTSRVRELATIYFKKPIDAQKPDYGLSRAEVTKIRKTISAEERDIVKEAIANEESPAQRIFDLAVSRNFDPAAVRAALAAAPVAQVPTNGKAPPTANGKADPAIGSLAEPPAGGAAAAPGNVTEEIDRIKRGTEAGKSLSSGGGAPASPMTAQKLANMSESEFAEFMETSTPEELRAHFGN